MNTYITRSIDIPIQHLNLTMNDLTLFSFANQSQSLVSIIRSNTQRVDTVMPWTIDLLLSFVQEQYRNP